MNIRETRFIHEYLKDENGTRAAQAAGYSPENAKAASVTASRLLANTRIAKAIAQAREDIAETAGITKAAVLRRMWEIATADANDLMQVRRVNCRHCWGLGFGYQYREHEYLADLERSKLTGVEPPSYTGGFGFDEKRDPNPECPACDGIGHERVHVADTRKLKGAAKLLYAGVKQTKYGIELRTHDQLSALAGLGKFLGLEVTKTEISGPDGAPIAINKTPREMSRAELLAILNEPDQE